MTAPAFYTGWMEAMVSEVPVHYAEYGSGTPVLALHGAGVDHREISGALEPIFSSVPGVRRLYPDLPGMGRTPAAGTITRTMTSWTFSLALSTAPLVMNRFLSLVTLTVGTWPVRLRIAELIRLSG